MFILHMQCLQRSWLTNYYHSESLHSPLPGSSISQYMGLPSAVQALRKNFRSSVRHASGSWPYLPFGLASTSVKHCCSGACLERNPPVRSVLMTFPRLPLLPERIHSTNHQQRFLNPSEKSLHWDDLPHSADTEIPSFSWPAQEDLLGKSRL